MHACMQHASKYMYTCSDVMVYHAHICIDIKSFLQYLEALVEDYHNLTQYMDYLDIVEEQYNRTLNKKPVCGYCVRFFDLKREVDKLMTTLENLVSQKC